jgi:hypothetical protein
MKSGHGLITVERLQRRIEGADPVVSNRCATSAALSASVGVFFS